MKKRFHVLTIIAAAVCLFLLVGTPRASAQAVGPEELYRQGVGEFAAGNFTDAARYFKELIANFGNEPSLQAALRLIEAASTCGPQARATSG